MAPDRARHVMQMRRRKRMKARREEMKVKASVEDGESTINRRKGKAEENTELMEEPVQIMKSRTIAIKGTTRKKKGKDIDESMMLEEPNNAHHREKGRIRYKSEKQAGTVKQGGQVTRQDYRRDNEVKMGNLREEDTSSEEVTTSSQMKIPTRGNDPLEDREEDGKSTERRTQKKKLREGYDRERDLRRLLLEARCENQKLKYEEESRREDENKRKKSEKSIYEVRGRTLDQKILRELRGMMMEMGSSQRDRKTQWMWEDVSTALAHA
ncbi:uncharacterized protein LOC113326413 [Papaver somniferum]|uniref:uncharacterized protein LOC113326413 n=1 Tax=Papaver somniferum TaxID=3469 RepID=UPI000E6F53B5|nr:uncharacterized protein LOC113326413 [Papaver somniferum]